MSSRLVSRGLVALLGLRPGRARPAAPPATRPGRRPRLERVTFDEAVARALEHNPSVGEAAQAILRAAGAARAGAQRVPAARSTGAWARRSSTPPAASTATSPSRGPRRRSTRPLSYPVLAASRWAAKNQAADRVGIARISARGDAPPGRAHARRRPTSP